MKTLNAIYCDDIRSEIAGKLSFMGVYGHEIVFPSFPAVLAKLNVHVALTFSQDEAPKKGLKIILLNQEKMLAEFILDEEALKSMGLPEPDADIPEDERRLLFAVAFTLSPFQAETPTRIRLRAYLDGEEIKGNGLKVRLATKEERPILGFPPLEEPTNSAP